MHVFFEEWKGLEVGFQIKMTGKIWKHDETCVMMCPMCINLRSNRLDLIGGDADAAGYATSDLESGLEHSPGLGS